LGLCQCLSPHPINMKNEYYKIKKPHYLGQSKAIIHFTNPFENNCILYIILISANPISYYIKCRASSSKILCTYYYSVVSWDILNDLKLQIS
jgi:hypothetical protein